MPDYLALKTELAGPAYTGLSDADAAAALNAPDPTTPAPKPFGFADVMGLLSAGSVASIRGLPTGTDLINKINAQDRTGIGHWVAALQAPPALVTADEVTAVTAVLTATVAGPSRAVQVFGVPVTDHDVNHARGL